MIRQANKYDKTEVIETIKTFYREENFETKIDLNNNEYYDQMFSSIIAGRGVIFIEEGKGLLVAMINNSIFDPKTLILNCIAWIVNKEYRNKTTGYKLLKAYITYAEQLKQKGQIKYYTIGKTTKTPNMKYQKLGFRKTDEIWAR